MSSRKLASDEKRRCVIIMCWPRIAIQAASLNLFISSCKLQHTNWQDENEIELVTAGSWETIAGLGSYRIKLYFVNIHLIQIHNSQFHFVSS